MGRNNYFNLPLKALISIVVGKGMGNVESKNSVGGLKYKTCHRQSIDKTFFDGKLVLHREN